MKNLALAYNRTASKNDKTLVHAGSRARILACRSRVEPQRLTLLCGLWGAVIIARTWRRKGTVT